MVSLLAIDPGTTHSGWVILQDGDPPRVIEYCARDENENVIRLIGDWSPDGEVRSACEQVRCMGQTIGQEVLDTVEWCGQFRRHWINSGGDPGDWIYVPRSTVKMTLYGAMKAKDTHIRATLCQMYGGSPKQAQGTKANPGPLYGISSHAWSALAVGVTALMRAK